MTAYLTPAGCDPQAAALALISDQLSATARDKAESTWLRLTSVLDVLFKYASAR
jgi:hypothetical protein